MIYTNPLLHIMDWLLQEQGSNSCSDPLVYAEGDGHTRQDLQARKSRAWYKKQFSDGSTTRVVLNICVKARYDSKLLGLG
jgi:hypothetical protein